MAYDEKFKVAVVKFYLGGKTMDDAVEMFSVSKGAVSGWVREYRKTGRIQKKIQNREHLRKITPEKIEAFLSEHPCGDQQEMALAFGCKNQSVPTALQKFGYSKKNSASYSRSLTL